MNKLIYHSSSNGGHESPFDCAILRIAKSGTAHVVSPYIDVRYLNRVLSPEVEWKVVSDVEEWLSALSVRARIAAWQFIWENIDRIHHCGSLHAKAVIGRDVAMLGSANLTRSGLLRRRELGILIEDRALVAELAAWFDALWTETSQPIVDETSAFIQWLDQQAERSEPRRAAYAPSCSARELRSRLVRRPALPRNIAAASQALALDAVAHTIVLEEHQHYESLDQAVTIAIDIRVERGVTFKLRDIASDVRRSFSDRTTSREMYLLVLQRCANHQRTVFTRSTENHLVVKESRFYVSSRDEVLGALTEYDRFLAHLIIAFDFRTPRMLDETRLEKATGFPPSSQVILTSQLLEEQLLLLHDIPGSAARYTLNRDIDWEGRYSLFTRARAAWDAARQRVDASSSPSADALGEAGEDNDADDPAPLWSSTALEAMYADRAARRQRVLDKATADGTLALLLELLFAGEVFEAIDFAALVVSVATKMNASKDVIRKLLQASTPFPPVFHVTQSADRPELQCLAMNPSLTWDALAGFPRTRSVCKRVLGRALQGTLNPKEAHGETS